MGEEEPLGRRGPPELAERGAPAADGEEIGARDLPDAAEPRVTGEDRQRPVQPADLFRRLDGRQVKGRARCLPREGALEQPDPQVDPRLPPPRAGAQEGGRLRGVAGRI